MTVDEYKSVYEEDSAPGWDAIDLQLEKIYPVQEPLHFAPELYYSLGGNDPLDGISIYQSTQAVTHHHIVTYGFSQLYYDEESVGSEFSKWGFELTFRIKPFAQDTDIPHWAISLLQNLARYVFDSKNWFEEFHYLNAKGPIRLETETDITALAFIEDPELGTIQTPHGQVSFLQVVGITTTEYNAILNSETTVREVIEKIKANNPLLVTDLERK